MNDSQPHYAQKVPNDPTNNDIRIFSMVPALINPQGCKLTLWTDPYSGVTESLYYCEVRLVAVCEYSKINHQHDTSRD